MLMIPMLMTCLGTSVMKVQATDADEPGNINSQILYEIIKQEPSENMFSINQDGEVLVNDDRLDREVRQSHNTITNLLQSTCSNYYLTSFL